MNVVTCMLNLDNVNFNRIMIWMTLYQDNVSPAGVCHSSYIHAYGNLQVLVTKLTRSDSVPYLFSPMEMHKLLIIAKKEVHSYLLSFLAKPRHLVAESAANAN